MPRIDWRVALRVFLGFLAGLAVWTMLSPLYGGAVISATNVALHSFEKPNVSKLRPGTENYAIVDRSDFDPRSTQRPQVPVHDLTFNFILLTALFAIGPLSDRHVVGFLVSCAILYVTHVLGLVTEVMTIYSQKLGMWSQVNYSDLSRNVWSVSNHFYRLVLMYAIAFALWWIFRGKSDDASRHARRSGRAHERRHHHAQRANR
ncbi:MAG TPA: exosortase H-associated membrane protein [Thermoanaerobaculia bacterium]